MISSWLSGALQHPIFASIAALCVLALVRRLYQAIRDHEQTQLMLGLIALSTAFSLACFLGSLHYAKIAKQGVRSDLTTDQVLAALSTNITILGGIVAVATIGIGIGALFGYAELRTATMRKTEDNLIKLIQTMQKRGDLNEATAAVLLQSVVPDRVIVLRSPPSVANGDATTSNNVGPPEEAIAEGYPEEPT